jgi:hypothetical protein
MVMCRVCDPIALNLTELEIGIRIGGEIFLPEEIVTRFGDVVSITVNGNVFGELDHAPLLITA